MTAAMSGSHGRRSSLLELHAFGLGASLLLSACIAEGPQWLDMDHNPYDPGQSGPPADEETTGSGDGATSDTGWPCEVQALLSQHCWSCHGATPPALDSIAALGAPSQSDPSKTVAEVALETMQGVGPAMPPSGLLDAASVAVFEDWLGAGMPMGGCGNADPADPVDTPVQCSTEIYWTQGDQGSHEMYPGRACIQCHDAENEGPRYVVAGTVYPTLHEPDDCYGTTSSITDGSVVITDANGQTHSLPIRQGGNFSLKDEVALAFPITAEVVVGGTSLAMVGAIDAADGDCNTCHTTDGADGAPGRILLP